MPDILKVGTPSQHCGAVELVGSQSTGQFLLNTAVGGAVGTGASNCCSKASNPFAIENSVLAADRNVRILLVPPGWNFLDVWLQAIGTSSTSISTSAKFIAYGFYPARPLGEQFSALPGQFPSPVSSYSNFTGMWRPLVNPIAGTTEQDLGTTISMLQDVSTPSASDYPEIAGVQTGSTATTFLSTAHKSVALMGASKVLVIPTQAVVLGGSGGSAPMFLGRLSV